MLVEPEPPGSAVLLALRDGHYEEIARSVGGWIVLDRPFPVSLDLTG